MRSPGQLGYVIVVTITTPAAYLLWRGRSGAGRCRYRLQNLINSILNLVQPRPQFLKFFKFILENAHFRTFRRYLLDGVGDKFSLLAQGNSL